VKGWLWTALGLAWLGGVVTGLAMMADFANRPGPTAQAPARWPAESRMTLDTTRPTLVMFAHPMCDCTRASLAELAELMARSQPRPKAFVVFIKPREVGNDWENTNTWRDAVRIPDVTVVADDDGLEARHFGAETSGQTVLYASDRHLLFSGGTTGARGHVGDNAGFESLVAILAGEAQHQQTTSVFGCSLFAPQDRAREEPGPHGS
jgi:hypothetical protein